MDFGTFIDSAWADHGGDPFGVAQRLGDGAALATDEAQLVALINLAHHVHGEHLGAWQGGIDFLQGLAALPAFTTEGASGQALRRSVASLALSRGDPAVAVGFGLSERIRITAMAAANLAERDTERAAGLLRQALDLAAQSGLPATDPMHRALAVTGNNLACTLEEKAARSAGERDLMLLAARASRDHWALAGTWLEVERAEYRLAMSWMQAGDAARARLHAQACLDIVAAHDAPALERFFGWEAMARALRAAGGSGDEAHALAQAHEAFSALDAADKGWCAANLAALAA